MGERKRWKYAGTAPMPLVGVNVLWVKSYIWHRVDENDVADKRQRWWWNVDLFWEGRSQRRPYEEIPEELLWNWRTQSYGR